MVALNVSGEYKWKAEGDASVTTGVFKCSRLTDLYTYSEYSRAKLQTKFTVECSCLAFRALPPTTPTRGSAVDPTGEFHLQTSVTSTNNFWIALNSSAMHRKH